MKAMVCEMCGSTELVKQNGMYVCQYCGTKYSVEEAKKLRCEYENKYGPLTATSSSATAPWQWSKNPWTWEKERS